MTGSTPSPISPSSTNSMSNSTPPLGSSSGARKVALIRSMRSARTLGSVRSPHGPAHSPDLHRSTLEDRTKKHTNGFTLDAAEKLGQAKLGYLLNEEGIERMMRDDLA